MNQTSFKIPDSLSHSPVRVLFRNGGLDLIGEEAAKEGARRVLLVTDQGIVQAGHTSNAVKSLEQADIQVNVFDGVGENPTTEHVAAGVRFATDVNPDLIIGLGGGSSMDCAKGINLLLTNGGSMADYAGINKATVPLLPLIAIPTTAGTGSEAQSFALISDAETHKKMACGDRRLPIEGGLRPRVAILDPMLINTLPKRVSAIVGMDAISHAVETSATNARNEVSDAFSKRSWDLLSGSFDLLARGESDDSVRANMLMGAHLAGAAIENSMLGAAHACANPLTANFSITHGVAVGVMLPSVIRFNEHRKPGAYALLTTSGGDDLAIEVEQKLDLAQLPTSMNDLPNSEAIYEKIDLMAEEASQQWTAKFNPVPISAEDCKQLYRMAFGESAANHS